MRHEVDARIAAIAEAIKQKAMEQEAPVDDLSKSLFEFGRGLAELDAAGRDALFEEWCASDEAEGIRPMSREQFDQFIADFTGVKS